jgi:FkbM family methyltransferase
MIGEVFSRVGQFAKGLAHELRGGWSLTADPRSFARFASDVLLARLGRRVPLPNQNQPRTIRLRAGFDLHYRLNSGDLQSIREVWIDECYRLPFDLLPERLVDLGANIGLASLWFAHRYGCKVIVAVEPSPENAELVRRNLHGNNLPAEIVEAAVGPHDGVVRFEDSTDSNMGRVGAGGREVPMVSMKTVLEKLPPGVDVDLVKMDIEGGEGPLLEGDLGWLGRVRSVIAEFHPAVIDYPAAIRQIEGQGFRYIPAHSAADFDSADAFVRAT